MRKFPFFLIVVFGLTSVMLIAWLNKSPPYDVRHLPSEQNVTSAIPDFATIEDINEKKTAYFAYLAPTVEKHNAYLLQVRSYLSRLKAVSQVNTSLTSSQLQQLEFLAHEYKVDIEQPIVSVIDEMLFKIDIIPIELVLIQSANESGWGTSRFAQQGFNFFGLWCFVENCGFVPIRRNDGASHEVAKFTNLEDAVYTYMRNLNRHQAYDELRQIRYDLRQHQQQIMASQLVEGLTPYSERGLAYIEELQHMLRTNQELMPL
ncbi:MAG: glucosaminidase domain-containing protein [Pseudomonadota bacterium]